MANQTAKQRLSTFDPERAARCRHPDPFPGGRGQGAGRGTGPAAAGAGPGRGGGGGRGNFGAGFPRLLRVVIVQFPTNPDEMLLSGVLVGGQALSGRAQVVDIPVGTRVTWCRSRSARSGAGRRRAPTSSASTRSCTGTISTPAVPSRAAHDVRAVGRQRNGDTQLNAKSLIRQRHRLSVPLRTSGSRSSELQSGRFRNHLFFAIPVPPLALRVWTLFRIAAMSVSEPTLT